MVEVITKSKFKTIPWKNDKGETVELAINEGGTIDDFDWRLSIASVDENGEFSDFSGYFRHLVLIKGRGVELSHDNKTCDSLDQLLSVAKFDGGCKTCATLTDGPISDFNLITKSSLYYGTIQTFIDCKSATLAKSELGFLYTLSDSSVLVEDGEKMLCKLPAGDLLKISNSQQRDFRITGSNIIHVRIDHL
ncbi:MAG: HutD family protein [Gammaproteobacteria bacterium]|nr:HutD family protein [Gammaproteobacteria bacterium]